MAYDVDGCISKCVFTTQKPDGTTVFYVSFSICISHRKQGVWTLQVRLHGTDKTEDLDLVCPKKEKHPRVIPHTHRPMSTKKPWLSTTADPTLQTTPLSTAKVDFKSTTQPIVTTSPFPLVRVTSTPSVLPEGTTKCPDILNESQCIVPSERIACLNSSVSRDTCLCHRCCHDPADPITPCYHGHTVTPECSPDGSFQLVISRFVTRPPLLLTSVVLGPGTCPPPAIIGDFLVVKGRLRTCSSHQFFQGQLMYELSISARPDVLDSPQGSITRDSILMVTTQCLFNITLSLTLVSVVVSPSPFPSVTNSGVLDVELRISKGSNFSEFYSSADYPLQILLREFIFFEVRLLQPSDPRLHLRLHHCWGAPSLDPAAGVRWPLINNGCPFTGDDPMTEVLPTPVPSSYQRFVVSAFTFLGLPGKSQMYIYCSVSVCVPSSAENCTSDCSSLKRYRRFEPDISYHLVSTRGPLHFQQETGAGLTSLQHMTPALPGILLAAVLFVLLCLVSALKLSCFILRSRRRFNVQ
ncbi:zona pellucida sperm-binding protein 1-like [Hyperolius riggenbachi]|uniref:zona pellucida sperm-binding protein 1-like n=1 Tax=Hyperolius riggenbachi TaxID=752182 RepID=UPI0035A36722